MRIVVVGSGYVGLVTAVCLADSGNDVIGVDNDARKVALLSEANAPFYEPGVQELLSNNLAAGRLRFSADLVAAVKRCDVIIVAVGTPPRPDGSADLSALETVAKTIAAAIDQPAVVVIKSTVPVGACARVEQLIAGLTPHRVPVVSNPEFLKQGSALNDFLRPDRVVIGADDPAAGDLIANLHEPFVRNNHPIQRMSRAAAELTKYAANAYLAMRISFINEIAAICEKFGVSVEDVRRGIGSDQRIGQHFLYPGVGYGGSCFPKDVLALASFARAAGVDCGLLESVHRRNLAQRAGLVERIVARLSAAPESGAALRGRRVAVWGLAFKPNTDDLREAPAVTIVEELLRAGAGVAVHDPRALDNMRAMFGARLEYFANAYDALPGAEALVILTEWLEFRRPDFARVRKLLRQPLIFDGRNLYDPAAVARAGFEYHSIGRPTAGP